LITPRARRRAARASHREEASYHPFALREGAQDRVLAEDEVENRGQKKRVCRIVPQILRPKAGKREKAGKRLAFAGEETQYFQGQSLCC